MKLKIIFFLLITLTSEFRISTCYGQDLNQADSESSLFLEPQFLSIYKKPFDTLTISEKWRIEINGLRLAPLDPLIWAIKKSDRTENRRLVPIRPLYLRRSEDKNFIFDEFLIKFIFRKVPQKVAIRDYHDKDSVMDIGFGGIIKKGPPLKKPEHDNSYVIRLSAFNDFKSGIYFRSYDKHALLHEGAPALLETGTVYELKILFKDNSATVLLNDKEFSSLEIENINKGLFYITTSWNPVYIQNLIIKGHYKDKNEPQLVLSGLINKSDNKKFQ